MSNIKKGSKLTVSTANGISRATTTSLGVLEVSGPKMSDVTNAYNSNPAHFVVGATDVSGILQVGINNDGNTFIDASVDNNHKDIILQKYGGNTIFGSGSNSTAKVGIGTTSPNGTLNVYKSGNGEGMVQFTSTSDMSMRLQSDRTGLSSYDMEVYYEIIPGTTTTQSWKMGINDDKNLHFAWGDTGTLNSQEKLTILNTGNVGIGTTNPTELLHIKSTGSARLLIEGDSGNNNESNTASIKLTHDGGITESIIGQEGLANQTFSGSIANSFYILSDNHIMFATYDNTVTQNYSSKVVIRQDSGNVGIGTTSMFTKLDVNGSTSTQGLQIISVDISSNTSTRPAIATRSTTLGINDYEIAAIPNYYTNRASNHGANNGFLRIRAGGGTNANTTSYIDLTGYATNAVPDMDKNIVFGTSGTERMRINSSGNVGIGTTNPQYPLHVSHGNIAVTSIAGSSPGVHLIRKANANSNSTYGGDDYIDWRMLNNGTLQLEGRVIVNSTTKTFSALCCRSDYEGGNVIIGHATSTPRGQLTIRSNVGAASTPNSASNAALFIGDSNNGLYLNMGTSTNGTTAAFGLNWKNSGGTNADVDNALVLRNYSGENRVGIGTMNPNYLGDNEPTPNSTNFPNLSKPGSGATAPIKLDVRGSIELSPEDPANPNTGACAPNIYFPANNSNALYASGLIWRNYHSTFLRDIKGGILFEPSKNGSDSGFAAGGLGFYTSYYNGSDSNYDNDNEVTATCKLTILGSGNVGIGTTNPQAKLHIDGGDLSVVRENLQSPTIYLIRRGTNGGYTGTSTYGTDRFNDFAIKNTGGSLFIEAKNLDGNGNAETFTGLSIVPVAGTASSKVGIGTTNPITMLDISCNLNTTGINVKGAGVESDGKFQFILRAEGPDDSTQRVIHTLNSSTRTIDGGANTYNIRNDYGNLRLGHSSYDTIIEGNVGIGTTNPGGKLQIKQTSQITHDSTNAFRGLVFENHNSLHSWYMGYGYGATFTIGFHDAYTLTYKEYFNIVSATGNVGIGTTTPKSGLQVFHDQGLTVSATQTTGERTAILRLGSPYDTNVGNIENYCAKITSTNNHSQNYGADLRFYTHPNGQSFTGSPFQTTERMRIRGDTGNIGIGVTNPSTMLQVQGQIHSYDKITGKSGGEFGVGTPTDYTFSVERKITPSDGAGSDNFGYSVSVYNNKMIVGATGNADKGASAGSAYIFDITTGAQLHKLYAGDAAVNDNFGFSVAISANYAIVGAPYSDQSPGANSGAAYIFDIRTGAQIYELTGSDLQGGAEFGWSVAIDNKHAAVGARKMDAGSADVGRIYVFELETGTQIMNTLMPPDDRAANDQLGYSVAIAGDYAAAGAVYDHHGNGPDSGAVYVFDIKSKTVVQALVPSDSASNDYFGSSVAMSGNYIIVGANGNDDVAVDSGSAYIFDVITGTQLHKLTANDPNTYDRFGSSVAISGNYAVVGAEYDDDGGNASGSAYVFDVRTGSLLKKIIASDDAADDLFGGSVSIDGNYIVVGSKFDDDNGSASGSAYVYGPAVLNPPTLNCNIPETVEINGNVGIGTSTPKSILNIVKKSKYPSEGEDTKMKLHRITWSDSKEAEKMFYRVYYGLRYSFFKHVNSQRLDGDIDPDGYAIMYKNKYNITEWLNGINVDISFNTYFTSFPYYNGASSSPSIFDAATVSFRAKQDCDFLLLSQAYAYAAWNFHGYAMVYDLYNNDYYTILFPHSDDSSSYQNGLSPAISLKAGRYYKIYFYTILYRYQYSSGNDYVYAWQTVPQSTLTSTSSPTSGYNLNSVHSNDISSNITEWFTQVNDSDYIEWLDEHDVSLKIGDSQCSFSINDPASTAPLSVAKEYFHDLSNNTVAEFKGTYPVKIKDDGYIESRGINNIRMTRELTKVSVTQWEDTTGSAPSGRYEPATWLAHDRYIYIRGGYTSTYTYGLYRYDLSGGSWTSFGNTSFSAIYTADVYDHENDILYFFGGSYSGGNLNGLNKYLFGADGNYIGYSLAAHGATGNPSARYAARMVLYNNCLYMFGGRDNSNFYNDLWKFDLATNTWTSLSGNGNGYAPDSRAFHNMKVYNGFIYIQGGYSTANNANIDNVSSFFMFDLHGNSSSAWTKIQLSQSDYIPQWNHRYGQSVLVDNYMLIWGGVAKNQLSGTSEHTSDYMYIVDLDNHTVERQTVPNAMVHCHATHYSKKLGKFFTVMGYDSKINAISPSGRIIEYTPYFSTVMKNNAEDINAWIFRESSSFNTYSWVQMKTYVRKYSSTYHGDFGKYDLPTIQWCLAHSKELEYRNNVVDTWVPCYDENGEKAWIHLGTTNHSHLKLHYPYPDWGDSSSSSSFRRAVVMVCRDKRTTDLKIEANNLIVRGESSSFGRPQDALVITNYCNGQSGYPAVDTNTKVTSMAILAAGENQLSAIYFGSNTQGRKFVARKTAIMCEGVHSYDRGKLHFCTQGTNHTDYQNVGISDSRMVIQHDGKVGIGTTSPDYPLHVYGDIATSGSNMIFEDDGSMEYSNTIRLKSVGHAMGNGRNMDFYITKASTDIFRIYAIGINNASSSYKNTTGLYMYRAGVDFGLYHFLSVSAYSGAVSTPSNGSTSDDRVKHNEKEILNGLETIKKLKPTKYFKTTDNVLYDENHDFPLDTNGNPLDESGNIIKLNIITESGFIAQRVLEIDELKHLVIDGGEDPSGNELPYSLCYNGIIAYNVKAIQEIDIIQQQEIIKVQTLQTDLSNANTVIQTHETTIQQQATTIQQQATKITTLETQIADILTRLSNLENTGSA